MKETLLIHLSDIHIVENSQIDKISTLIVNALLSCNFKDIKNTFIIFTGDMTASAEKEQFAVFDTFIKKVKRKIKESLNLDSEILLVPGNHDSHIIEREYPIGELLNGSKEIFENLAENELFFLAKATELCKKHKCFLENDFVSVKTYNFGDFIYRFTLINSAPLSSIEKNDKEHHFIGDTYLNQFPKDYVFGKKTIDFLLMHHRPDWFEYNTKAKLDSFIERNVSIAFFGHEHDPKYKCINTKSGSVIFDEGGELVAESKNINLGGSFSFSFFDTRHLSIERHTCFLNYQTNTFIKNEMETYRIRTHEILPLKEEFVKSFYKSPLQGGEGNLLDVFVMPSITTNKDNFEVSDVNKIIEKIKSNKLFVIEGSSKTGKTTLLKAIFAQCQKVSPCLFLKITSSTNDNAKKMIKDSFENMYGDDPNAFKQFQSFDINSRYVFVDNFEILKDTVTKTKILDYLKENFGGVIISYSKNETPKNSIKEMMLFSQDVIYRNYGITAKGRRELVRRVCELKGVDNSNVDAISNLFEREINGVNIFDFTDPSQGLLLLETIIDQKLYLERNTNKAFAETFTYYLDDLLVKAGSIENLDSYKTILSALAFDIWKNNKGISFNEEKMMAAYSTCHQEGRCDIKFKHFQEVVLGSGVIYEYGLNNYRFKRNSYLSYYVAQEIIRITHLSNDEYIQKLIDNIRFGLNSDILLFILFHTKEIKPIIRISELLNSKYVDVKKIDFNNAKNVLFSDETVLPAESDKNKITKTEKLERKDASEKTRVRNAAEKENDQMLDVEEDEEANKIIETLKMVEIVSKAISGFQSLIDKITRKALFDSAFNVILRMLANYFTFTNEEVEQLENDYSEYKTQKIEELSLDINNNQKEIDDLKNSSIKNFLFGLLIETLTMYESVFAYLVASKQTISFIDELQSDVFENCVFKLYCYIFMGNFEKFVAELKIASTKFNPNKIDNLVKFFARIYIIHNNFTSEQLDRLCSVSQTKKASLLPYASREEKIIK